MAELLIGAGSRRAKIINPEGRTEWTKLTTLDYNADHKPNIVWDLNERPLPFDDETFTEIHAYEVLEHLGRGVGDYRSWFEEWSEWWRLLKPGGYLCGTSPSIKSPWLFGDPSHCRVVSPASMTFLNQPEYAKQIGRTPMSDFRFCYKCDFDPQVLDDKNGETFFFAMKAVKPSRIGQVSGKHLFLVLPSYTGHIWIPTMTSLFYGLWALPDTRIELCPILFDAQIAMSRSQAAMLFLASDATDLVMCDWDVVFSAEALARLISHEVDVVGGDYPRRREPISYSSRFLRNGKAWNLSADANGLIEVEAVPSGLLRISRAAIVKMVDAYPDLYYIDELMPGQKGCALFSNLFENNRSWGEDISFCRRWRKIGGQVYLDPEIKISHWGHKQFHGDYHHWLEELAKTNPDAPEFIN